MDLYLTRRIPNYYYLLKFMRKQNEKNGVKNRNLYSIENIADFLEFENFPQTLTKPEASLWYIAEYCINKSLNSRKLESSNFLELDSSNFLELEDSNFLEELSSIEFKNRLFVQILVNLSVIDNIDTTESLKILTRIIKPDFDVLKGLIKSYYNHKVYT